MEVIKTKYQISKNDFVHSVPIGALMSDIWVPKFIIYKLFASK